jgi:hypothetical protein
MMPVTGWVVSTIFGGIVGTVFGISIASLNKKVVRDRWGNIDFKKSDIYFYWTRWDTIMVISAIYSFFCLTGLFVFLLRGDTINNPVIQFFLHQTFMFTLITFIWLFSRIIYVFKGIKERWSNEFYR